MRARRELPLLVGAAVDDEVEKLTADSEVVEERATLGRGSVGGDGFAFRIQGGDHIHEIPFQVADPVGESFVGGKSVESGVPLFFDQFGRGRGYGMGSLFSDEKAQ